MRMIREPCARYSPVPSEPCSEQDRAREQFHLPVVAAQHAEAERSAPTASRAPLPGNRRPLPDGFETHSSFTLSIHAARNCQPRRKDRKSTRLNSSHLGISYAVFCLK